MKTVRSRLTALEKRVAQLDAVKPPSYEAFQLMYEQERAQRVQTEVDARDFQRGLEDVCAELEGLVWLLRGHPPA